jgi:hypothetical protein
MGDFGEKMAAIPHILRLLLERVIREKNYSLPKAHPEALVGRHCKPTSCPVPSCEEAARHHHQMIS